MLFYVGKKVIIKDTIKNKEVLYNFLVKNIVNNWLSSGENLGHNLLRNVLPIDGVFFNRPM